MQCAKTPQFYKYFKENMESLGLPAPNSLFSSTVAATGAIKSLSGIIARYGGDKPMREVIAAIAFSSGAGAISAAATLSAMELIGACTASFYLGACIGSFIVATTAYTVCHAIPQSEYRKLYMTLMEISVVPQWMNQSNFNNTLRYNAP